MKKILLIICSFITFSNVANAMVPGSGIEKTLKGTRCIEGVYDFDCYGEDTLVKCTKWSDTHTENVNFVDGPLKKKFKEIKEAGGEPIIECPSDPSKPIVRDKYDGKKGFDKFLHVIGDAVKNSHY